MNSAAMVTRSSLELMLESIRRSQEHPNDLPPALPLRPASKGRLPRSRRCLISSGRVGDADFRQEIKVIDEEKENSRVLVKGKTWFGSEIGVLGAKGFNSGPLEENFGTVTDEVGCSGDLVVVLRKVGLSKETSRMAQQSVLVIQKYFRGHLARLYYHELKNGVTTLQSFVLGENVRKKYQLLIRRQEAAINIQKHVKKWIARVALNNRERAISRLQSVVRGWLTRKHLSHMANLETQWIEKETTRPEQKFSELKEFSWSQSSVLVELQNRVMKAEEALEKKKDENAILHQRLQQSEKRWSEYEAKMKAMEETWQKQLTALQMSLGDKKDMYVGEHANNKTGPGGATPMQHHCRNFDNIGTPCLTPSAATPMQHHHCNFEDIGTHCLTPDFGPTLRSNGGSRVVACLAREFQEQERAFDDDVGILMSVKSEPVAGAPTNSNGQLRKLKLRFEAWKKDYKNRLRETKTMLQRIDHSGTGKSRKKWWGHRSARGILGF